MATPKIAVFPKCYLNALVPPRSMTWLEWVDIAAGLPHVEGLEAYPLALDSFDGGYLGRVRHMTATHGLETPMMCASPDFTQPDPEARRCEIERQREVIDAVAELGGHYCRVLSGQRRPGVGREEGIAWAVGAIEALLPHAERRDVVLVLENHYKDGFWDYPEFAQASDVFLEIVSRIDSPYFGVNFDPSNAIIAGDDPVQLLETVKYRVRTMHASDRSLKGGTLDDLRRMDADPMQGYAPLVLHGVVGRGLVDYDAILRTLASVGFTGWISLEDGQSPATGLDDLRDSAVYLRAMLDRYFSRERQTDSDTASGRL